MDHEPGTLATRRGTAADRTDREPRIGWRGIMHPHPHPLATWAPTVLIAAGLVALAAWPGLGSGGFGFLPGQRIGPVGGQPLPTLSNPNRTVNFTETGLPSGTHWTLTLDGVRVSGPATYFTFSKAPGSYYWGVTTGTAFTVSPAPAGVVTVRSSSVNVHLHFAAPDVPHPIQHVVVIVLENEGAAAVAQWGPYENYLANQYGEATSYFAACHHSAPNYLAMVSAVTNQCDNSASVSDRFHTYTNTTLGDLVENSGQFTWAQFVEELPNPLNCLAPGLPGALGEYAVKHVPFAFFQNSTTSPPSGYDADYCGDHIEPSSAFNRSAPGGIGSSSFVNLSFYTPNLCDDGHNDCVSSPVCPPGSAMCDEVQQADTWLQGFLGPLLNGTGRYANSSVVANNVAHTAFLVTYDESGNPMNTSGYAVAGVDEGNTYSYCANNSAPPSSNDAVCGGLIPLTVISPYGASGENMSVDSSIYSIDGTVEWLFGLTGPNGVGMENPGHFDWKDRWADPGFPTFEWLLGISGNGYSTSN